MSKTVQAVACLIAVVLLSSAVPASGQSAIPGPIVLSTPTQWPGKIFVNNDNYAFTNLGFALTPDVRRLALNLAAWFTGGRSGNFLVYSTNGGLTDSDLAATMRAAGHTWTISMNVDFSMPALLEYDAVWLMGDPADNSVLIDYVRAGGHVYVAAGTGWGWEVAEAARWNVFLNAFGLNFQSHYNNVWANWGGDPLPISSDSPIFAGVQAILEGNGNSIEQLDPTDPDTHLFVVYDGAGLYATYETRAIPVFFALRPETCPAVVNARNDAVVSGAIFGTPSFDVRAIDETSIQLLGVPASKNHISDAGALSGYHRKERGAKGATRPLGNANPGDCFIPTSDRLEDLVLEFSAPVFVRSIEAYLNRQVQDGDVFAVTVTGKLKPEFGGNPIVGEGLLVVRRPLSTTNAINAARRPGR